MRKQAINSSSLRIAVRKNYSLLLVKISLFAFASVAIVANIWQLLTSVRLSLYHGVMWSALHGGGLVYWSPRIHDAFALGRTGRY